MVASVTQLDAYRREGTGGHGAIAKVDYQEVNTRVESAHLRDMYPLPPDSRLERAFTLLSVASDRVESAKEHFLEGNFFACDDELTRFRIAIRELFLCRSIGDGFAQLVNGLNEGMRHLQPDEITLELLVAIGRAINTLRNSPALSFDVALDKLEGLDSLGLRTDVPEFGILADLEGSSPK